MTGSTGGFGGNYPTEAACKADAQKMVADAKAGKAKESAHAAAAKRANPNAELFTTIESGPPDWKCVEAKEPKSK